MVGDDSWWTSHWEEAPSAIFANISGASAVGFDLEPADHPKLESEQATARGFTLSSLELEFRKTRD
jgi:hypothetical protein